ncbi:MAG: hypothetical protein ACTSO9_15380 [Candidatus Helarchaeota archaeon]
MSDFDPHIHMVDKIKAKDSSYMIKEIKIEHLNIPIKAPYKILDGKRVSKNINLKSKLIKNPIYENAVYIWRRDTWKKLHYLLEEAEQDKVKGLNNLLGIKTSLWDSNFTTISLVFARNPFVKNYFKAKEKIYEIPPFEMEIYDTLLDHIHSSSNALILSPDIKIKSAESINLDDYLSFIDHNIKILSKWNKKPIFVPIQIDLSFKKTKRILMHY